MTATQYAAAARATDNLRVLIVDDDWDQAEGLVDLLEPRGHQLAVAHNIDEARRRLADFDVQVALIDVRLGTESGNDLAGELAKSHPDVLCVMITAYADLDNTIESLQQGVFDFLRKPLNPASLFISLGRCAGRIRLQHEKAETEEALRQSEEKFRGLVESSSDWIWEVDREGVYTYASPQVEAMLGYKPQEIVGKTPFDLMSPEEAARTAELFKDATAKGEPIVALENVNLHKDGRRIVLEASAVAVLDAAGGVVGYRGVDRDITDRKRAESEREELIAKLEAQNAELERFTYTVSHELKSPLITIQGYVGVLRKDLAEGDSVTAEQDLARISNAASKMDQLLRELLKLSRVGRVTDTPQHVSLEELAREAIELIGGQAKTKPVQIDVSPGLPVVFGDRMRLREVLQNLIDNAVKYMGDQSEPRIEVGSRPDGNQTICYVRDNGIGIEPCYHERVFGLFDQLDQNVEGSGVGLALVRRIVEVHGGRVWVESEGTGRGATFCFTIADQSGSA